MITFDRNTSFGTWAVSIEENLSESLVMLEGARWAGAFADGSEKTSCLDSSSFDSILFLVYTGEVEVLCVWVSGSDAYPILLKFIFKLRPGHRTVWKPGLAIQKKKNLEYF